MRFINSLPALFLGIITLLECGRLKKVYENCGADTKTINALINTNIVLGVILLLISLIPKMVYEGVVKHFYLVSTILVLITVFNIIILKHACDSVSNIAGNFTLVFYLYLALMLLYYRSGEYFAPIKNYFADVIII